MSTEYFLDKDRTISIDERSSKLYLSIDSTDASPHGTDDYVEASEMSPAEMVEMFIRGLQICSYNMTHDEFTESVSSSLKALSCEIPLEVVK